MPSCPECQKECDKFVKGLCSNCYRNQYNKTEKAQIAIKSHREKAKPKRLEYSRAFEARNKEARTAYRISRREKTNELARKRNADKSTAGKKRKRTYTEKQKLAKKEYIRIWKQKNKEKHLAKLKQDYIDNPEKHKEIFRKKHEKAKKNNPFYLINRRIREALYRSLRLVNAKKAGRKTYEILGYTREDLATRRDFFMNKPCCDGRACGGKTIITESISHIDHIIPLITCKNEEDVIRLNQLENLRWICAPCNLSKNDTIPEEQETEDLVRYEPLVYTI